MFEHIEPTILASGFQSPVVGSVRTVVNATGFADREYAAFIQFDRPVLGQEAEAPDGEFRPVADIGEAALVGLTDMARDRERGV